jgi:DNA-binding CsgD family transcriptional regulator
VLLEGNEYDAAAALPLARLHLAAGDAGTATAVLRRAVGAPPPGVPEVPVLMLLAEILAAEQSAAEAVLLSQRITALAAESRLPHVCAMADRAAAVVAPWTGEAETQRLRAAVLGFGEAGLPWEAAGTRLDLARRLAATEPTAAVAEGRGALAAFRSLGARRGADEAASLLRGIGAAASTPARSPAAPLTPRERDVLRLMVDGRSNEAIARELFLSKRTVEHHVGSVLAKLGLPTRAEVIARALRAGL